MPETAYYTATCRECGAVTGACVDDQHPDVAKDVSDWIKRGRMVQRVTERPAEMRRCSCPKGAKPK